MRKRIIKILVFLTIIVGIIYIGVNLLLDVFSNEAIHYVVENMKVPGLELGEVSFQTARISSFKAATWEDFGMTATIASSGVSKLARRIRMDVEEATAEAAGLFGGHFIIRLKGLNLSMEIVTEGDPVAGQSPPTLLQDCSLTVPVRVDILDRARAVSQIRKFASDMMKFSDEGKTAIPLEFSATEFVTVNNSTYILNIWVEKRGALYQLVADKSDLEFISGNVLPASQTSTPADIDIIALNPLRAPQLLRIRSKAARVAANAHADDPIVPEDAYRHVLWSYLLTKEYGTDFARQVTDAHELTADETEKNGPDAGLYHRQNYHNNEAGRLFAQQGVQESDILHLVMTDPKVIRDGELR
jgi:hypothetical protein